MKKTTASLLAIVIWFGSSALISAQAQPSEPSADLDKFVQKTLEKFPEIPGIAVVVIKGDKPAFLKAYGMADKESGVNADVDTMWYIASSTKSFTALAAALMDKDGKIMLDDPVMKYTAGMTLRNPIPEKVKIRDLLIHTSGLRNGPLGFRMAYSGESDPKDMAKVFADGTTFNDEAYGRYAYTNLGYNIYAVLLQNHLKMRWQDLLQKRVFDPLGMDHTTSYISRAKAKKWKVAAPYMVDPGSGNTVRSPLAKTDSNLQSAGGMFASASDLGRWLIVNINDGRLGGKQIFPAEIMKAVHTGHTTTEREQPPFSGAGEYGLGWQIGKYGDKKVIYHHGGFPGYRSHISYLPEQKIGVAVLVNEGTIGGRVADLVATYAYDRLTDGETVEADYAKRLEETFDAYQIGKKRFMDGFAERAKRPWQLSEPRTSYAGTYENNLLGRMEVAVEGESVMVRLGSMRAKATAFTEKETIRVELIPGMGEVIRFTKNADGQVESLSYGGNEFKRIAK
ncbi:MAG TPA: serine hydrolase domain-containing protein [Pyrinomonadaceae bacterium]